MKKDRVKYIGVTILFVLCFIIVTGLYQNSFKPEKCTPFKYQVASLPSFAVSLQDNQLPNSSQDFLSPSEKINSSHFNEHFKIFIDNKLIKQKLISLSKIELLFEPLTLQGLYYHYISHDNKDLPILS